MRIGTLTNWAYGVTLVLTSLAAAAFLASASAAENERLAVERHLAADILAENLAIETEKLSDEARLYAVRGDARHLEAYRYEAATVKTRDEALRRAKNLNLQPGETAAIAEAERNLAELNRLEAAGVALAQAGRSAEAQALLFGPEHERAQSGVLAALDHFRSLVTTRTDMEFRQARRVAEEATLVAKAMLALTALLFLGVLYFVLRRRVALPLARMTGVVSRLANEDYAVEVPMSGRRDEIGEMAEAIEIFRLNGLERDRLEAERQADRKAKDAILQMMHRLQAAETRGELAEVVSCFAPQTFPQLAGRLYMLDENRNALILAGSWQDPTGSADSFAPTACWGLRRGRPHASNGDHHDIPCPHVGEAGRKSLCVPLTAQGDTLGLLYFEETDAASGEIDLQRVFLDLMADNVALTLANLRLRERLASLAVRDGLTGLLNRRTLDETLDGYVRAPGERVACIMIDIDHFKRFNDTFGHDAGDAVMQHVAQLMGEVIGDAGSAYRFGGEEFTVLLPGADAAAAVGHAEALRRAVRSSELAHHGRSLGRISISLGVAVTPDDAPAATLLRCADAALLQAKAQGRDRVVMCGEIGDETAVQARAG